MRFTQFILCLVFCFAACSKKTEEVGAVPAEGDAANTPPSPQVTSALDSIDQSIETKQYDAAVQTLIQAKVAAQNEADQQRYQEKLQETQRALRERAETDPQARQSYEALGRIVTGR